MAELDEFGVALRVAAVLDELGIEYTLAGSLASSLYGEPRFTNDVDFAVRLERWADQLGVQDLLQQAFDQASSRRCYVGELALCRELDCQPGDLLVFENQNKRRS